MFYFGAYDSEKKESAYKWQQTHISLLVYDLQNAIRMFGAKNNFTKKQLLSSSCLKVKKVIERIHYTLLLYGMNLKCFYSVIHEANASKAFWERLKQSHSRCARAWTIIQSVTFTCFFSKCNEGQYFDIQRA